MIRTPGWIVAGFAIALLSCTGGSLPEPDRRAADEDLDGGPQEQYPELTLEAQRAAMKALEERRRAERIEGLRDKIPPADWIEIAYHGLVLDANLDVIEMNSENVSRMQESLFSILHASARERAIQRFGADPGQLLSVPGLHGQERLAVGTAVLNALLAASDPELQERYAWRHQLIRRGAEDQIDWSAPVLRPKVLQKVQEYKIPPSWYMPPSTAAESTTPGSQYVAQCRAAGVPIPPDWPDAQWINQGPLAFLFVTNWYEAEVHTYKDPAVPGVCYAMPRRNSSGSIQHLEIICQSDTTGKACFWENRTLKGKLLTGVALSLDIESISNGSTLAETCTACHRGDNAFNIHPGTALDLKRATVVGGPYDTDPAVRFTPIGQAHWSNPGSLTLPPPPPGQRSCTTCHGLPKTSGFYCRSVLANAAQATMPPGPGGAAGWPPGAVHARYADHIAYLSSCP